MIPTPEVQDGWARIPGVVATDDRISHASIRVYVILALSERGGRCSIGLRRICELSHVDMKTARSAIATLVQFGHIESKSGAHGGRTSYSLTDTIFGAADAPVIGAESEQKGSTASVPREMVSCPRCAKRVPKLLKVGYCRSCGWKRKVRDIVREEMEASA